MISRCSYMNVKKIEKFELLTQTSAEWKHTDLATNEKARQEVGRSLAIFSIHFTEGVSLYSSFVHRIILISNEKQIKRNRTTNEVECER